MPSVSGAISSGSRDARRRPLRADARRNRNQVLAAARAVFVELGANAPLDEIARRAGVGIGTLYRHFPDRAVLVRAVVLDVLTSVGAEAVRALDDEPDAFSALARYMRAALEARIAAVFQALLGSVALDDAEITAARDAASAPVVAMLERARAEGTLRPDATFSDVGLLLIRLSRPLPGPFPSELNDRLAHRHLDLVLAGLRAGPAAERQPFTAPGLSLEDLRNLGG
jgi:AcrR family transcriptional regulator